MAMRADPEYGRSSFGYTSQKCVERCCLWKKQLNDLLDFWKEHPDFSDYREAIQDISELGDVKKAAEIFFQLSITFLKTFAASYTKLVESCWHHWRVVWYIVAGDPTLAQMFLNWLVIVDQGIRVDDYRWPSTVIELKGHAVSNQTIEVNTRECLE